MAWNQTGFIKDINKVAYIGNYSQNKKESNIKNPQHNKKKLNAKKKTLCLKQEEKR